jgi:hypothetical protein
MATNTYVALDKVTVVTATNSITFSSIPQGYTDLIIVTDAGASVISEVDLRVGNSSVDTGSNYSRTIITGNGSTASSLRSSNQSYLRINHNSVFDNANGKANHIFHFMNYSNTTTNKTILYRGNAAGAGYGVDASVGLWRSTSAINIITLYANATGTKNFLAGSTFELYGILAEGVSPTTKATGGAVYSDSTYYYHVFGASGTFTPTQSITADVLVVAGGGGGGDTAGGGGGAGGLLGFNSQSLTATGYTVTVGGGGTAGSGYNGSGKGGLGGDSQFGALTLVKGGGGGGDYTNAGGGGLGGTGLTGGSGGGGGVGTTSGGAGGAATSGQGSAGGAAAIVGSNYPAGGGGGAGAVGNAAASNVAGNGGVGLSTYSSWGLATGTGENVSGTYYYAGGGGGAQSTNRALGGYGGGGLGGSNSPAIAGAAGLLSTGGGGGGGRDNLAGKGGSGVVIVRYAK